jgi:hypothetical protein
MTDAPNNKPAKPHKRLRRFARGVAAFFLGLALAFVIAWWIMIRMPGTSYSGPLPPADAKLTALADELRGDIAGLAVDIGPRNVLDYPEKLSQAADRIEAQFKAAGYTVSRQEYEVGKHKCSNLEVEIPGAGHPDEIVVIGAHYDTAHVSPGANDNTSGVAATLALARKFSKTKPDRTLRFVAFVNEEPPYFQTERMGSWVYAKRCRERKEKIVAMLSLETIGYFSDEPNTQNYPPPFSFLYPSTGNFIGFIGNTSSRGLVHKAITTFRKNEQFPSEGAAVPASIRGVGFSDHWSFWQEGYPAVMVTDTAICRYPYYHTSQDTVDKIDFDRMARVVRGLESVVADLAGVQKRTESK